MNLLPFFQWCEATAIGAYIRQSTTIFPVIEVFHLFGLTVLLGTLTIIDLRILGIGMRRQSIPKIVSSLGPLTVWAGIITIVTGILLFLSEALKCYDNQAFPWKMWLALAGILLYLLFQRRMTKGAQVSSAQMKIVAVLSLVFWYGVALAGRAIAFI
ncbi:MAG: DUF6644 family protein [Bryobacteraceae bacterium]|jgi:hypothetical protein